MADEAKVKIDIGSADNAGAALGKSAAKEFKKGVEESVENLDSGALRKKLASTFSMDGLKKNFKDSFQTAYEGSAKFKKSQISMEGILKKNATLSKNFTAAIAGGAGKTQILNAGLKLASNHVVGMLKNMNPYVLALKAAAEAVKAFLQSYQKTLEQSSKFITGNSLFADKGTMSMMQRTGQSASGAQGTMRSLDRLGIGFEDLQTGQVTKAQMAMFEELRKSETARLETIARIGGPVFESMQYAAVAMATAKAKFTDMVTYAYAKGKGVLQFANSLRNFATEIGDMFWSAKSILTPIVNIIGTVLGNIMHTVNIAVKIVSAAITAVTPVFDTVNEIVDVISNTFGQTLDAISQIVDAVIKPTMKVISSFLTQLMVPIRVIVQVVGAIVDGIFLILKPILSHISMMSDIMTSLLPVGKGLKDLQPILDIITTSIKILGAAIGWLLGKIGEGTRWVLDKIIDGVTYLVNLVPKAFHNMINSIIDKINQIPGVSVASLGTYKSIDIGAGLSGLNSALNKTLASIQGDTFNYNYGSTVEAPSAPIANQNLFMNTYTLVND